MNKKPDDAPGTAIEGKQVMVLKKFILLLALAVVNAYIFNWINDSFFQLETHAFDKIQRGELFFLTVILGPIIETFLLQYLPNKILMKLKVQNIYLLVVIPSVVFAFGHLYYWLYAVAAFFGGLILNYYFLWLKNNTRYYIYITMLFHATYNLYGFLFMA